MKNVSIEGSKARAADRGGEAFGLDIPDGAGDLLTSPAVTEALTRGFLNEVLDVRKSYNGGGVQGEAASALIQTIAKRYATIFMGGDPSYSFNDWNSPEQLGVFLSRALDGKVEPDGAAEAFFLRMASDFIDQAVVPFEDDKIDMEEAAFRMDATVEDATFALRGLENTEDEFE